MASDETRESWAQARDLFLELVDADEASRVRALDDLEFRDPSLAARVRDLLAHDRPLPERGPPAPRFGPYETVRSLGSGGMGEVWLARRADGQFEREVAIKVMRQPFQNEEARRRFDRERQMLAALDHEYIARLLDSGTLDSGVPYLVLEYVAGLPLDEYSRRAALATRDRLRLFQRVLLAVEAAHRQGVIHRDLKPMNILVRADGAPRLLDFGIARLSEDDSQWDAAPLTRAGHRLFTPGYSSPEQLLGTPVSERSDVYSLGVVLHELLTGRSPWPRGGNERALERAVLEGNALPPSRCVDPGLAREFVGDLDTIVEKCLRVAPDARYSSVRHLAEDIERHLGGEPIEARPTTAIERTLRQVRRHKVIVGALLSLLASGLVAFRFARDAATRRAELVRATEARVTAAVDLRERGKAEDSRVELEAALATLRDIRETEDLRARTLVQLGITANHRGKYAETIDHTAAALSLLEGVGIDSERARLTASALNARSFARFRLGDRARALESAREAIAFCREHLPPGDPRTIDALVELADQQRTGKPSEQDLRNIDAAVEEARRRGDPHDSTLGSALNLAALLRMDAGRYEDSARLFQEAIDALSWHHGEGHEAIALLRSNRGDALFRAGRLDEAETEFEKALSTRRALGDRPRIALSLEYRARLAIDRGRYPDAERDLAEARPLAETALGATHSLSRRIRLWAGIAALESGAFEAGERAIFAELAAHGTSSALPPDHEAQAYFRLGRARLLRGDREGGRSVLVRALPVLEIAFGAEHRDTVTARGLLGAN